MIAGPPLNRDAFKRLQVDGDRKHSCQTEGLHQRYAMSQRMAPLSVALYELLLQNIFPAE